MKAGCFFLLLLGTALAPAGEAESWQEVSSHLFSNTAIVWQVGTNRLPARLSVYQRMLPHVFPFAVISNAVVLGSLQTYGFPKSSTNDEFILPKMPPNWPGTIAPLLSILPGDATLSFEASQSKPVAKREVPPDAILLKYALQSAEKLGLVSDQLGHHRFYSHTCDTDTNENNFCGRGVFFPRYIDGIPFFSAMDDDSGTEGYSMLFGQHGMIQAFAVHWSEFEKVTNEAIISRSEISRCIHEHKMIVMPNFQSDDFARLRKLGEAKKLTITAITPYYGEGMFADTPTNSTPPAWATPFVELEAMADFENSNSPVKILTPILASEMNRLFPRVP